MYQDDHSSKPKPGDRVQPMRIDDSDADLWWLGIRALGQWDLHTYGEINYWLDAARVQGREVVFEYDDEDGVSIVAERRRQNVRGWGVDFGVSWTAPWLGTPTFTLAYAYGSGDSDLEDGIDRAFRQTGLHDNKSRFGKALTRLIIMASYCSPSYPTCVFLPLPSDFRYGKTVR